VGEGAERCAHPVLAAARLGGDHHAGARSSGAGRRPVGEGSGEFGIWERSGGGGLEAFRTGPITGIEATARLGRASARVR
jgi:hypothetical protein